MMVHSGRWFALTSRMIWLAMLLTMLSGCGGGGAKGAVKGKVTFNGEAVKGGGLTFSPVSGGDKGDSRTPVACEVQPDGTFSLSAKEGPGAGKVRITYSAPSGEEGPQGKPSPYAGLKPKQAEVDIQEGDNDINVELTR